MTEKRPKPKQKPGPEPDRLKIEVMDWETAVKKALHKPRPKEGWPESPDDQDQGQKGDEKNEGPRG